MIPLVVSQTKHSSHFAGTSPGPVLRVELRAGFAAQICVPTVNVYTDFCQVASSGGQSKTDL